MLTINWLLKILTFLLFFCSTASGFAETLLKTDHISSVKDISLMRVQSEIARVAKLAGGTVGVSALHIESGESIGFNASERFPMASTYKIPIAYQLLKLVDRGEISLSQMIELKQSDLRPGSGIIASNFTKPGVALSVRNLLEIMLISSDNTATDLLLKIAGGQEAVTAGVRDLNIRDMDINRPTANLIADSAGYTLPPEREWTPELFKRLFEATTSESRKAAADKFEADPRDTSTPEAMVMLLEKIFRGQLIKPESRDMLLDIMKRCRTGTNRLKGILPAETTIANKTGSIGRSTNDVGIITLPDNAGHVAVAVFIKSSSKDVQERERAIAQIARTIYDFFFLTVGPR